MVQNVAFEVDLESLEKTNNIVGNIYFVIDYHRFFPDDGWSDFVIMILSWWIESLKGLMVSEPGKTYTFNFMDGTPVVFGKKIDTDNIEMAFCFDRARMIKEFTVLCRINELKESLLSTSNKVLRAVKRYNRSSDEIDHLKDLVLSLSRYPTQLN